MQRTFLSLTNVTGLNASFATIASQGNKVLSNLNDTFTAPKNGFMFVRAGNDREGSMGYAIRNNNLRCCEFSQSTYSTQWFPVKKGDVLTVTTASNFDSTNCGAWFVPWE